jgi:TRAP-type C4-dicarboxylate transport system permease small subunit
MAAARQPGGGCDEAGAPGMTTQQTGTQVQSVGLWNLLDRGLDLVAAFCKLLTGISMVVLTSNFGWLVFGRYVLNSTPTWVEQVSLLLVMLIAFLGAAVGVHENTHLSVTAFRSAAPDRLRAALVLVTDLLMAGFGLAMAWYGTTLTIFKWGSKIPLIQLPEGLRSLPLAVGGGLIFLFAVGHVLRILRGADRRSDFIG